jgi:hypothetical protein
MRNWVLGAGAAAALSMLALTGSGVAAASPDVVGQKYSDAQSALSSVRLTPVVQFTVGDQKAWPDCIVTRTQRRTVQALPNTFGSSQSQVLVSLDCNASVAAPGEPGPSVASPQGRAAAAKAAQAAASSSSG